MAKRTVPTDHQVVLMRLMADALAETVRCVMRASVSSNPREQSLRALEHYDQLMDLMATVRPPFNPHELFNMVIRRLRVEPLRHPLDEVAVRAAKKGVRYLIERSCRDSAAGGRASVRRTEFLTAIAALPKL